MISGDRISGPRTAMSIWQHARRLIFRRFTAEDYKVYRVQLLLLFVLSTLLYVGFPGTREWRRVAEESQMHTIMRGWDGLAWYTWLAAAPFMLLLVQRFPFSREWRLADLVPLAAGCFAIYLGVTHARYALRVFADSPTGSFGRELPDFNSYAYNTFAMLPLDLLTFCGFFAVSFAVDAYYKRQHDARTAMELQIKAAQLQSELARAELAALRGQLHPHFLFNSFNALSTLVRQRKNDAAVEIIAQLSALLRMAIDRTGLQEIPLQQEIEFIQRYLDIEHVRFGEKLRVVFDLEPAALDAMVPNIVLQPLVENAIKHGISLRTTPGVVRLAATHRADRLRIEIVNDGPEQPAPDSTPGLNRKTGIGLSNARAQLSKLYGNDYQLEISRESAGITIVSLSLPWRRMPAA
jgi:two-component system LytT family sensor kinase